VKVLVIGYGNPGRLDDGLGPVFAECLRLAALPDVDTDSDYQLTVEDAEAVSRYDAAVFVDASVSSAEPFEFRLLEPSHEMSFTTHDVEPGAVMALAGRLFESSAQGFILAIRGYDFNEFGEGLSEGARANLDAALSFLQEALRSGDLRSVAAKRVASAQLIP
jgi:hydrogenase maturation protease